METETDGSGLLFFLLLVGLAMGAIGFICGSGRGRGGAGFLLGFLLGPLGWIVALFLPPPLNFQRGQVAPEDAPVQRKRKLPLKEDPLLAWERQQRAKEVLEVPEHLRGRQLDE